jgi:microcystin-dependent protein
MKKTFFLFFLLAGIFSFCGTKASAQDYFIGELRPFTYTFAPYGWLACEGQPLSVSEYSELFAVIGYIYGGSGSTFYLPDLRGKAIIGFGPANAIGTTGGTTSYTIALAQMPPHTHTVTVLPCSSTSAITTTPGYFALNPARGNEFNTSSNISFVTNLSILPTGSGQAVNNMQPYTAVRWCICVYDGVFPTRD